MSEDIDSNNLWITNLFNGEEGKFRNRTTIPQDDLIIAKPKATTTYTSEELASMGMIGIYRKVSKE